MESQDIRDEEWEMIYGEDYVDVTEDVICYEKGKTFECECGQGFGTVFDIQAVKCPKCNSHCVDKESQERGPPDREEGQKGISDFL